MLRNLIQNIRSNVFKKSGRIIAYSESNIWGKIIRFIWNLGSTIDLINRILHYLLISCITILMIAAVIYCLIVLPSIAEKIVQWMFFL